ncbi:MAG: SH3 domain-containing protein [Aureispira sp.]|nr:SH3 domain-containing protein [Aureispira sp.]
MKFWLPLLCLSLILVSCNTEQTTSNSNKTPETTTNIDSNTVTPTEATKTYTIVKVNNLRVRSTPDKSSSDVIGMLKENTLVTLTNNVSDHKDEIELRGQKYNEHWYEIETDCIKGWIYGGALDREVELAELPEVNVPQQISFLKNTALMVPPSIYSESKGNDKPLFSVNQQRYFNELSRAFFNIKTDKEFDAFWPKLQEAKDTFMEIVLDYEDEQITSQIRTQLDCSLPYFSIECGIECLGVIGALNIAYVNKVVQDLEGDDLDETMNITNKILGDIDDDYYLGESFESSETRGGVSYACSNLGSEETLVIIQQLKKLSTENPNSNIVGYLVAKLITHSADSYYFSSSQQEVLAAIAKLKEINLLIKSTEELSEELKKVTTKLNTASAKQFNSNLEDQSYD